LRWSPAGHGEGRRRGAADRRRTARDAAQTLEAGARRPKRRRDRSRLCGALAKRARAERVEGIPGTRRRAARRARGGRGVALIPMTVVLLLTLARDGAAIPAAATLAPFQQDTTTKAKGHKGESKGDAKNGGSDSTARSDSAAPKSKGEMPTPEKLAE